MDQSVDLVVPILLLFPRFGMVGGFVVFRNVFALNFGAWIDAKNFQHFERSEKDQASDGTPGDQNEDTSQLVPKNLLKNQLIK